ncbi:MAG: hypothetical protein NXH97_19205 [Rhodobacteraceae bacterium]|nr:hypothetical protein [Paracoccaceae bacterium]
MKRALLSFVAMAAVAPASAADYMLRVTDTGQREYYCTVTVALDNVSSAPVTEISGFFFTFADDAQVGRSKGSWFLNVAPGDTAEAVFETPNAPCAEIDRYDFVIGACRIGQGFDPKSVCAERIGVERPISRVMALGEG